MKVVELLLDRLAHLVFGKNLIGVLVAIHSLKQELSYLISMWPPPTFLHLELHGTSTFTGFPSAPTVANTDSRSDLWEASMVRRMPLIKVRMRGSG